MLWPLISCLLSEHVLSVFCRDQSVKKGGGCFFVSDNSSVHFTHCSFRNNAAAYKGGALHIQAFAESLLHSCDFYNNSAIAGGAVSTTSYSTAKYNLENCTFRGNRVFREGALYINGTSVNVSSSEFQDNVGPVGSAIYFSGKMSVLTMMLTKLQRNNFDRYFLQPNHAGSLFVEQATNVVLVLVSFIENKGGGGMILNAASGVVHNCSFLRNNGVLGGAIATLSYTSQLVVADTIFVENKAPTGSAMWLHNSNTMIQSCFFANNTASVYPTLIRASTKDTMDLRFYNNTFCAPASAGYSSFRTIIALKTQLQPATVYLWKTFYQFRNKAIQQIDSEFLHNKSMPKIFYVPEGISFNKELSQFASGLYSVEI